MRCRPTCVAYVAALGPGFAGQVPRAGASARIALGVTVGVTTPGEQARWVAGHEGRL